MNRNSSFAKLIFILLGVCFGFAHVFAQDSTYSYPSHNNFTYVSHPSRALNLDSLMAATKIPAMFIEAELAGRTVVQILVDAQGRYVRHVVLKEAHPALTRFVESFIPQIRWKPYLQTNGGAIPVWVTVPFQLDYRN